jgi:membrane peptidoglycan carboxypeptidase
VVAGGTFVFFVACMFGGYEHLYDSTAIPTALTSATQQNDIVYYSNGTTEIGTIGTVNRQDLALNQIPTSLQDAYIAAEDKNFWTEGGISPDGILRSAYYDVFDRGSGNLNGGSTLTEEFAKNYYGLGLEQSASVKLKEILLAEKLTNTESKQWILDNYLNTIFLGQNSYGVSAAAETYFGEPVSKLTISQDALLGGLPQAPSTYPLVQYKSSLEARWQYVMGEMVKDKFITQAQANTQKFPTLLTWADPARGEMASNINPADSNPWDSYVLSDVETELTSPTSEGGDGVSTEQLNSGGMKIVTDLSVSMEKEMYSAVDSVLSPSDLQEHGSQLSSLPLWAMTGAEVQNPQTGAIVAIYPGAGENQSASACKEDSCYQDAAINAKEQVGSSFKPYVVSAAVKQNMDVQTSTLDTSSYACIAPASEGSTVFSQPITAAMYAQASASPTHAGCPSGYFPEENDAGESIGKVVATGTGAYAGAPYSSDSVQDALAQSSNVAFTDLIHKTGTDAAQTIAEEVGAPASDFTAGIAGTVGEALGEAPMTVNNQTSLVAMLADNGTYHSAHFVQYWQDGSDGTKNLPVVKTTQVLTAAQASQVQYAMEKTTVDGTAAGIVQLSEDGREVIGKTGTTSSNHSGFFIGAIPQYAMAVGMFTQSESNTSQNLGLLDDQNAANIYPTMIWNAFMEAEFANTTPENFQTLDTAGTTAWNLMPPLPKPKPTKPTKPKTTCPNGNGNRNGNSTSCTPKNKNPFAPGTPSAPAQPSTPSTPQPSTSPSIPVIGPPSTSPSASPSSTATAGNGGGNGGGHGGVPGGTTTQTASAVQVGVTLGGVFSVLPGSLVWVEISRRKRKKK